MVLLYGVEELFLSDRLGLTLINNERSKNEQRDNSEFHLTPFLEFWQWESEILNRESSFGFDQDGAGKEP